MHTMVQAVILVTALVLATCQGKVVVTEEELTNRSTIDIIKNDIEPESEPTITSTLAPVDKSDNAESIQKFETDNTIDEDDNNSNKTDNIEKSNPLILTPLIENGLIEEARLASRVDSSLFLEIESYSGFITVNKTYNSNVFFWYFPVEKKPVNETPWIIWLQGGPGASSLIGLFEEIGPFKLVSGEKLIKNPFTWLKNHSLLFIDNPIGAGFSFTEDKKGFVKDMDTYAKHLFQTVLQFLQVFPELRLAPLFVAGESYAGKYVPALAMEIHKHKHKPGQDVNLQGLIIGNAYVDPAMISHVTQTYYYFGLLDKQQIDTIEPLARAFQKDIANNNSVGAKNKWMYLITILLLLTNQKHAYNFMTDEVGLGGFSGFLKKPEIKKAIHVGEISFAFVNVTTNFELAPEFLTSAKPLIVKLLEDYRVLAYCGQLDLMLPCVFTSENYRTWKWNGADDFLKAVRLPYMYDGRLAGYIKSGGHLTEVIVRGAGHMAAADAPGAAQALIAGWTRGRSLAARAPLLETNFVTEFIANHSSILYL